MPYRTRFAQTGCRHTSTGEFPETSRSKYDLLGSTYLVHIPFNHSKSSRSLFGSWANDSLNLRGIGAKKDQSSLV